MFAPWRDLAIREHYRSLVSVPLRRGTTIGVLNAYRSSAGEWTQRDVDVLSLLAAHAAIAIKTAHLLDDSRRQINGLSLMVRSICRRYSPSTATLETSSDTPRPATCTSSSHLS